ncbi:hypothetical protein Tco_1401733 [Tanacetum coccineum]
MDVQFICFFCGSLSDEYGCPCSTFMQTLEEKQNDTESMQELLLQLFKDLQTLGNTSNQLKQEEQDSSQYWKPPDNDEHLDTIPETDSDEEIKSIVKNLNITPKSLLNKDTVITSPKIDFLLEEFVGKLALINPIPPGIAEPNFDPKEAIRLIKKLLYDNSSPRPPEELNSEISDAIIKSFFPTPIPVEYKTLLMEGDRYIFLLRMTVYHLSFHFDRYYVPSFPRPPEKPPDDDGSYFDIEPDMGVLTAKAFNHGIFSKEEKSPHFLSHRGFKTFQIIYDFSESSMMIYGGDMLILDVPYIHFYPP